ncbi:DUF4369 domain-containing protein [Flavobacterium sp.]|uniref:DUF4369 domain-containing protein n=1 Tax=Flavobacterium sp. TaxID=239 RepID=UPI0028BF5996|nr:DUF4369 domain-containing protein [Flavobacterium sp.]
MKVILSTVAALFLLAACNKNETENKGLDLTVKVDGLKQGKLYIQKINDTSLITLDSIDIKGNSEFTSQIELSEPEMLYLSLDRGTTTSIDNLLPFFAEPGKMTIETSLKEFFFKAKVTGSENHDLYEKYNKTKAVYTNNINKNLSLSILAQKKGQTQKIDSLDKDSERVTVRRYLNAVNFAVNNGKHEVAPYIALTEIYDVNVKYLDTIQKSMSPEVAKSKYGKQLTTFIEERRKTE